LQTVAVDVNLKFDKGYFYSLAGVAAAEVWASLNPNPLLVAKETNAHSRSHMTGSSF